MRLKRLESKKKFKTIFNDLKPLFAKSNFAAEIGAIVQATIMALNDEEISDEKVVEIASKFSDQLEYYSAFEEQIIKDYETRRYHGD